MAERGPTIAEFFFGRRGVDRRGRKRLAKDPKLAEIKQRLGSKVGRGKWGAVAREIGTRLVEVLDVGIAEKVLGPAWSGWEGLHRYRDPAAYPGGKPILVPLEEHGIESTLSPNLSVTLAGSEIARLEVEVGLALELARVTLRLHEGKILGVHAGEARGRGSLTLSLAGHEIWSLDRESKSIELDRGIDFPKGIPIAKPAKGPAQSPDRS